MHPPTSPAARERLEHVFGVRWTKWVARYWPNLQDERDVPRWVGQTWQKVTHKPFDLKGGGLVFVHEDDDIVVLLDGDDMTDQVVTQEVTPRGASFDQPPRGAFRLWMTWSRPPIPRCSTSTSSARPAPVSSSSWLIA